MLSSDLGPLYHWSPRGRLSSINRLGLVPGMRNLAGPTYHDPNDKSKGEFRQDGVCFSTDPATAWAYSHETWRSTGKFDLWMVILQPEDEVHILPMWGGRIIEVRVKNRIPKRRLIWVGEREVKEKGVLNE